MSNLLTGLAMALGGGLKGYMQGKELQRQQLLEDEDRKRREAMDRRREEMENLNLAMQGVYREGQEPMAGGKIVTPDGRQVLSALTASLGVGGGVPVPGLQGMTDRAGNAFRDRYEQLTPGFKRDVTTTEAYKEQEGERKAAEKRQILAGLARRAAKNDLAAVNEAATMGVNFKMPEQESPFRRQDERTGHWYEKDPATGRMVAMRDDKGNPFGSLPPRDPKLGGANASVVNQIVDDYRSDSATIRAASDGYRTLRSLAETAATNPVASMGALYAYIKLIDPGSVVREGEYAALQKWVALDDRVRRWFSRVTEGTLTGKDLADLRGAGMAAAQPYFTKSAETRRAASTRAQLLGVQGIDPLLVDPWLEYAEDFSGKGRTAGMDEAEANYAGRRIPTHETPFRHRDDPNPSGIYRRP